MLLALIACDQPGEPGVVPLSRGIDFSIEDLPDSSRPGGEATPVEVPLSGWVVGRDDDGVVEWRTDLPVSHIDFGHSTRKRPQRLELMFDGSTSRYDRVSDDDPLPVNTWSVREELVRVRRDKDAGPPEDASLHYQRATDKERRLNFAESGLKPEEFVTGSLQPGQDAFRGLFMPAPTALTWEDVLVPERGVVGFEATIFDPPWVLGPRSDGATVVLEVDGEITHQLALEHGGHRRRVRIDVSEHAGERVDLRLRVDGGDSDDLDYVFLEEPALYTPKEDPRRVVLIFVDTLRVDALGVYGASAEDSPNIDAWAAEALVFEQARSSAPWTLPSARTALSGRHPDHWDPVDNLPARLAREGFLTHGVVGNAFLDTPFGMGGAWSRYAYGFVSPVRTQIDRALGSLKAWRDRDVLLMVHLMEPHMPYREPEPFRSMWAPEPPVGLSEGMSRGELQTLSAARREEAKPYVRARYRQNVRYLDHELQRLLAVLDDDDLVVFYSDHGEEFWEHGSFEHGHTLHDELLRVPLMVRGPGVESGRSDVPVSLLDITPTILDALELPYDDLDGASLLDDLDPLRERALGFGYLLYGTDEWGLLTRQQKWVLSAAGERLYDLAVDPAEKEPQRPSPERSAELAAELAEALGRPVHAAWRIGMKRTNKRVMSSPMSLVLRHPAGFSAAWSGYDPLDSLASPKLVDGELHIDSSERQVPREIYALPADVRDPRGLELVVTRYRETREVSYEGEGEVQLRGRAETFLQLGDGSRAVKVGATWVPAPSLQAMPGVTPEREDELRALGYLD